jgi:hypothetical protein
MPQTIGEVFGRRVEQFRTSATPTPEELAARGPAHRARPGISQPELTARLAAIGYPVSRVAIANIEAAGRPESKNKNRTRGDNATMSDVFAIALALDVPPLLLCIPIGAEDEVTLGALAFRPDLMFEWARGDLPPRPSPDHEPVRLEAWERNSAPVEMFYDLRELLQVAQAAEEQMTEAEHNADAMRLDMAVAQFEAVLRELDRLTVTMARAGMTTPPLPERWVDRIHALKNRPTRGGF